MTTVVTVFMLVAGANFALYYFLIWRGQAKAFLHNPEFRLYAGIFVVGSIVVAIDLVQAGGIPLSEAARQATFHVASIQTTTGFAMTDFDLWPALSKSILLVLMLVGACAGSTGGALKVVRVLVVAKYAYRQVVMAFSPRSVMPLRVGGEVVPEPMVAAIVGMAVLYAVALTAGYLVMSALGLDPVTAFSSVAATIGNVGPGLAGVGPAGNYALIPAAGKLVLAGCMLVGRLEFVTAIALVSPAFWHWR